MKWDQNKPPELLPVARKCRGYWDRLNDIMRTQQPSLDHGTIYRTNDVVSPTNQRLINKGARGTLTEYDSRDLTKCDKWTLLGPDANKPRMERPL